MATIEIFNTERGKDNFTSLSYSFLSSILCGEKVIQNAIDTWEDFGFTVGIEDEDLKAEMSVAFDNLTYDFITSNETIWDLYNLIYDAYGFEFDTIAYPLVRYVMKNSDYFDYEEFIDELYDYVWYLVTDNEYEDTLNEYEGDSEAMFVSMLGDVMISRFSYDEVDCEGDDTYEYDYENNEDDEYYY